MTIASRTFGLLLAALSVAGLTVPATGGAQDGAPVGAATSGGGIQYGQPTGIVGDATLYTRPQALLGRSLSFRGRAVAGQHVAIQRLDRDLGTWLTASTTTADAEGDYVAAWKTDHIGVFTMRVIDADNPPAGEARTAGSTGVTVTVYKPALATWYGPGFYGKKTACGVKLTKATVGVAHRGLPCGRNVAIFYKGHTIIAPVVDRGPFEHGANWDLTKAAADQLGFTRTDTIGAVSLPADPAAPAAGSAG